MDKFAVGKKLETFEDFDKVYDECLKYLREEKVYIDQETQDFNEKDADYESVGDDIKVKFYPRGKNNVADEESIVFDEKQQKYEDMDETIKPNNLQTVTSMYSKTMDENNQDDKILEEKSESNTSLHQETIIIGQENNVFDENGSVYGSVEVKIQPTNNPSQENVNVKPEINLLDVNDQYYGSSDNITENKPNLYEEKYDDQDKQLIEAKNTTFVQANNKPKIYLHEETNHKNNTQGSNSNNNNNNNKVFQEKDSYYESIDEGIKLKTLYQVENELKSNDSIDSVLSEAKSERLRKLSQQLPKIIITQSNSSLNVRRHDDLKLHKLNKTTLFSDDKKVYDRKDRNTKNKEYNGKKIGNNINYSNNYQQHYQPRPKPYDEHPKRLVCKRGVENVALISNVPFERIRLLNDTFHTLINLRWRWIVTGTIVVHFAIWLVFAVFWYIAAYAHYDFEPNPPAKTCVTGGHDFLTIFLASVESQTTIGFGDRAIDEECPESIFLLIMQLILGTGLSGVLTCVVYAKLTRPEKLSRDGVGFSKKAVISARDGRLCLMMRAWDLNYDHIISSEFTAHFINTHKTKEGEIIRYFAQSLALEQRQFLLWPVTLVHVIDSTSPLYKLGPEDIANDSYEITLSLKGASASMGTFTQSQTSYLPKEVVWGYRFPSVIKYDVRKQKYVIEQNKLDVIEPVETPFCSAQRMSSGTQKHDTPHISHPLHTPTPGTPGSFSEKISSFQLERSSSFRKKGHK